MKHTLWKCRLLPLALCLCLMGAFLTACAPENTKPEALTEQETAVEVELPAQQETIPESEIPTEQEIPAKPETAVTQGAPVLLVGTVRSGFKAYPIAQEGQLTPDQLIAGLADLTGWNLDLAEPVTTGKGGMSVVFTKACALVVGPPQEQKEEFMVLDNYSLANWVLDSIEATLQNYFVLSPGDPSTLDIYFSVEMEPVVVEDRTLPSDQPWDSECFFS